LMAAGQKSAAEARTDKAGCAGHEDTHLTRLSPAVGGCKVGCADGCSPSLGARRRISHLPPTKRRASCAIPRSVVYFTVERTCRRTLDACLPHHRRGAQASACGCWRVSLGVRLRPKATGERGRSLSEDGTHPSL
jgi:hypothetical protein